MAVCVQVDSNGFLVSDSTPLDSCSGYVMQTAAEYRSAFSWLELSAADGLTIGGAIFLAWAVAFGFRMIRKVIDEADVT